MVVVKRLLNVVKPPPLLMTIFTDTEESILNIQCVPHQSVISVGWLTPSNLGVAVFAHISTTLW